MDNVQCSVYNSNTVWSVGSFTLNGFAFSPVQTPFFRLYRTFALPMASIQPAGYKTKAGHSATAGVTTCLPAASMKRLVVAECSER